MCGKLSWWETEDDEKKKDGVDETNDSDKNNK